MCDRNHRLHVFEHYETWRLHIILVPISGLSTLFSLLIRTPTWHFQTSSSRTLLRRNNFFGLPIRASKRLLGGNDGLQKILFGDAQSRFQNFDHRPTSKSVILWPITLPNCCKTWNTNLEQIGWFFFFFGQIFHNACTLCKLGALGLERRLDPPTDTKNGEKAP